MSNYLEVDKSATLPLETLDISQPAGQVYLNQVPYTWVLDSQGADNLVGAFNYVRHSQDSKHFDPQRLELRASTACELPDPEYDFDARAVIVAFPQAIHQPETLPDILAEQMQQELSHNVLTALHQAWAIKAAYYRREKLGQIAIKIGLGSRYSDKHGGKMAVIAHQARQQAAKTKLADELAKYFDEPPLLLLPNPQPPQYLWARRSGIQAESD